MDQGWLLRLLRMVDLSATNCRKEDDDVGWLVVWVRIVAGGRLDWLVGWLLADLVGE